MLLLYGAVNTVIDDQECQHVMGRLESVRMLLTKQTRWPTFDQLNPSVKATNAKAQPVLWLRTLDVLLSTEWGWEYIG